MLSDNMLKEVVNQVNTRGMASVLRERGIKRKSLERYLDAARQRGIVPRGGWRGAPEPPKQTRNPVSEARLRDCARHVALKGVEAAAAQFGVSTETVRKYMVEARRRGFAPPAKLGRPFARNAAPELKWEWDGNAWVPAAAPAASPAASPAAVPVARQSHMRRFVLERTEDLTGTSGTGVVAEGVVFSNGHVAYSWISPLATVTTCQSIDVVERLHGHGGRATVRFLEGK